jgi:hypothetical protein
MALITDTYSLTTTEQTAASLRKISEYLFAQMRQSYAAAYKLVWSNSSGLTPQQVCDALGTDAAQLFAGAAKLSELLAMVAPSAASLSNVQLSCPAGYSYTANADGTVTITQQA